ncbi:hypothetical protein [Sandarakinorhabdus sp.]|uniref:hypothetical protein n=1 Tax=Sandarakinorhabdus sp. TaxID=1916663 RepID=UPI0033426611
MKKIAIAVALCASASFSPTLAQIRVRTGNIVGTYFSHAKVPPSSTSTMVPPYTISLIIEGGKMQTYYVRKFRHNGQDADPMARWTIIALKDATCEVTPDVAAVCYKGGRNQ